MKSLAHLDKQIMNHLKRGHQFHKPKSESEVFVPFHNKKEKLSRRIGARKPKVGPMFGEA